MKVWFGWKPIEPVWFGWKPIEHANWALNDEALSFLKPLTKPIDSYLLSKSILKYMRKEVCNRIWQDGKKAFSEKNYCWNNMFESGYILHGFGKEVLEQLGEC